MRSYRFLAGLLFFYLLAAGSLCAGPRLTPLATAPDWKQLDFYQQTITRAEFVRLINEVYSPDGGFWKYCQLTDDHVLIFSDTLKLQPLLSLIFAPDNASARPRPLIFAPEKKDLPPAPKERPLEGVRICLDPGHVGGEWSKLEERFFQIPPDPPVEEAELNWLTCQYIAKKLTALGATVSWSKEHNQPATPLRPGDLRDAAIQAIVQSGGNWPSRWLDAEGVMKQIDDRANGLFYRTAEIRARAQMVQQLKPDLTLCVHFNAGPWGDAKNPQLVDKSKLVFFVNGAYSEAELAYDDEKFEMLVKLLDRTYPYELRGAELIATEMEQRFQMIPEVYKDWPAVKKVGPVPGVYARNLIANRLFPGPVIFVEGPYMNARDAYAWIVAGDYEGTKSFDGSAPRQNVFREYADAVVAGVVKYFAKAESK